MKNAEDKPATFILKLTNILRSKEHAKVISWDHEERGIKIHNQQKLEQSVLPRFYRHNKFASFVRQLNMYDFHKIYLPDHSSIFYHQTFDPKNKENLHLIRRKNTFLGEENQTPHQVEEKPQAPMKSAFILSFKGPLRQNSLNDIELTPEQVLQEIINQLAPLQLSQASIKNKIAQLRVHKKFRRFLKRGSFLEKLYARLGIQMDNNEDKLSQLSIEQQLMFNTKKSLPQKSLKLFESGNIRFLDSLGMLLN